jgi:uncharacterized lipoprotein YddW (UPF0748 family)
MSKIISIITALILLASITLTLDVPSEAVKNKPNFKGVWFTKYDLFDYPTKEGLAKAMERLLKYKFTNIYVDVDPGCTVYPSTYTTKAGKALDLQCQDVRLKMRDFMSEILKYQDRIEVCGWMQYGYMSLENQPLYEAMPEVRMKTSRGSEKDSKGHRWLNPFHPEVISMTNQKVKNLLGTYPSLKCVQYDDHFGFSDEMGYDKTTVDRYKASNKGSSPSTNSRNGYFTQWRNEQLTAVHQGMIKNFRSMRKGLKMSISPNPIYYSYSSYMQDIWEWVNKGMADEIVFQVYRNDVSVFTQDINEYYMNDIKRKVPTYIGIAMVVNDWPLYNNNIIQMRDAAKRVGFGGVALFYHKSMYLDRDGKNNTYRDYMLRTI